MNILIIDDQETDLKLLSAVLSHSGHHVLEKDSADQAVEEIKAQRPEMILLDLKLPGVDGLTLARQLKTDPETRHIPIIAMTALPEQFGRAAALAAGCDDYLAKPVNTRDLPEKMAAAGERKSRSPDAL